MTAPRYVLTRLNWRRTPAGHVRLPGDTPVASFPSAAEAEADRARREAAARAVVNPFAAGPAPFEQTSMPPAVFRDWLLDAGVAPPAAGVGWAEWWAAAAPGWTAGQRERAWDGLDRVRFFAVAERPARPVVYAVVEVVWGYNDEWMYADGEGGTVTAAYRSRDRAEAECRARNERARGQWAGSDTPFEATGREAALADPFGPTRPARAADEQLRAVDEVPFYEVAEVELEGGG